MTRGWGLQRCGRDEPGASRKVSRHAGRAEPEVVLHHHTADCYEKKGADLRHRATTSIRIIATTRRPANCSAPSMSTPTTLYPRKVLVCGQEEASRRKRMTAPPV
ncbi:MAG: hypothetical protein ACLRNW_21525 [Neglectibacter sp.]